MPSPKECSQKFKKGSTAYKNCIAYRNQSPVKGRARNSAPGISKPTPGKGY